MKQVLDIAAIMFLSREVAHREHLKTGSDEYHRALAPMYEGIGDFADELLEVWAGLNYQKIGSIPYRLPKPGAIDDVLEGHLHDIEVLRDELDEPNDRPLQNIIDGACALYGRTLYKLRNLS